MIFHQSTKKHKFLLLKFCYINARSVCNKALAIADFILSEKIDICAIKETWLSNNTSPALLNELIPNGFKLFQSPRTNGKGGGVAIISRDYIKIQEPVFQDTKFANFESLNCIASFERKNLFIGAIYRPPPSRSNGLRTSTFFQEWQDYLEQLILLKHEILLVGDINFHLDNKTSPDTKKFLTILNSFSFVQLVDSVTHIGGHILDFVATPEDSTIILGKPKAAETFITGSD